MRSKDEHPVRAGSAALRLTSIDDEAMRRRERVEHERLLRVAHDSADRIDRVTERIRRMTRIYDERLEGNRRTAQ